MSARLSEQRAKLKGHVADQKIKAMEHVDQLEEKLAAARANLSTLKHASEEKWDELAGRFDRLSSDIGASFKTFFSGKNSD